MSGRSRLDRGRLLVLTGIGTWVSSACIWVAWLWIQQFAPRFDWLYDWHVYAAGARDLVAHDLYHSPLTSGFSLPVDAFNYPPLAAAIVVPLMPLPDQVAGTLWVALNLVALAATAWVLLRAIGIPHAPTWAGILFLLYTFHPWFALALLGNNTPLVLFLVVAAFSQNLGGRSRRAGILLGVAIGLKIWPVALLPSLLRDRAWTTLGWALGTALASGAVFLPWLGLDVVGPAFHALGTRAPIDQGNLVLGFSWLRENVSWWPSWGGLVAACLILMVPARGLLGTGLGLLAGLAAIPNLWRSYVPAILAAGTLIWVGLASRWEVHARQPAVRGESRHPHPEQVPVSADD